MYGVLVMLLAFGVSGMPGNLVESVNTIIGLIGGPLLGVFFLGMFTRRATTGGALIGCLAGFATLVLVALGIAVVNIDPPIVLFALFVVYGLSGYVIYVWRKAKGQPTSMISTSTDDPDERGLHQ
jgi:Na+/proline symporter